jgi:hypothetical protein
MVYNAFIEETAMKIFKKYGSLFKHDIGVVFDNSAGMDYIGTAMLCKSPKHTSISINSQDIRFASNCFQYVFCQNNKDQVAVIPMAQAKELFKRGRNHGEFVVIEWFEIQEPDSTSEIPFN